MTVLIALLVIAVVCLLADRFRNRNAQEFVFTDNLPAGLVAHIHPTGRGWIGDLVGESEDGEPVVVDSRTRLFCGDAIDATIKAGWRVTS